MGALAIFKIVQVVGGAAVVALASAGILGGETLTLLSVLFGVTATGTVVAHQLMETEKEVKINSLLMAVNPIVKEAPVDPMIKEEIDHFAAKAEAKLPHLTSHTRGRHRKSPREMK